MDNIRVLRVEVQENENGEIVCVEKMDKDYSDICGEFCVVECEIAPIDEVECTTDNSNVDNGDNSSKINEIGSNDTPVEILVYPNYASCDSNENTIISVPNNDSEQNTLMDNTSTNNPMFKSAINNKCNMFNSSIESLTNAKSGIEENNVRLNEDDCNLRNWVVNKEHISSSDKSHLWTLVGRENSASNSSKTVPVNCEVSEIASSTSQVVEIRKTYEGILPGKSDTSKETDKLYFSPMPFQCNICDKTFRQASSLKIHLKVHAGKYSDSCILS